MRPAGVTILTAVVTSLVATACAADQGVVSIGAERSPDGATVRPAPDSTTAPPASSEPPGDSDPTSSAPPTTTEPVEPSLPPISEPELLTEVPIGDVVDIDENKPRRDYDAFVGVALSDIQRWWSEQYPAIYGDAFEPIAGGIYAGYPERQSPIPGCGETQTRYEDINLYVAFYCHFSDFLAYDDGDGSILAPMADEFGPAVLGIVLAHEYGHAIQSRTGVLDRFVATIYTEQQADCFAGAWAGQAYRGESPMLRLGDADVRAGLIAMLEVRDPVGTDQFVEGGHGSAFDRVGAFQEGFARGAGRCSELIDQPLTLMPNRFRTDEDFLFKGNAPYFCEELRDLGFSEEAIADCTPAPEFLAADLNHFWTVQLGGNFPPLAHVATDDIDSFDCSDAAWLTSDVLLCPSQNAVAYDEPDVLSLYRDFGDFTLGYFYGIAWAERVQQIESSPLAGEQRALLNDCYTGAWVADITPDEAGNTGRSGDSDGDGQPDSQISSSPGDLDEAIRMAIIFGDAGANVNSFGSPFEKIESFRAGVLGGLEACRTRFTN